MYKFDTGFGRPSGTILGPKTNQRITANKNKTTFRDMLTTPNSPVISTKELLKKRMAETVF